jgi:MOSC domain-containing protein YiiM
MLDKTNVSPLSTGQIEWSGVVRFVHITPRSSLPMRPMSLVTLVAGKGIEGDRYMIGEGFYSHLQADDAQLTLFELETLVALKRDAGIDLGPEEHRRNVTVEGVPLNHLVGRQFWLGETLLEGTRLVEPCRHIEKVTGKAIAKHLINRSGLYCKILKGGIVRVGDLVRNGPEGTAVSTDRTRNYGETPLTLPPPGHVSSPFLSRMIRSVRSYF